MSSELKSADYALFEFCCSPTSAIGTYAPAGAVVVRCTKDDNAKNKDSVRELLAGVAHCRELGVPVVLWASMPCTGGSSWQTVNIARFGVTPKLRGHWEEFRSLWNSFSQVARLVLQCKGLVANEWPQRCQYWHDRKVKQMIKHFTNTTIDSCAYGLRPVRAHAADEYIGKPWRIAASSRDFAAALNRRCDKSHRHVTTEAAETAASAYYPPALARAIHAGARQFARGFRGGLKGGAAEH